MFNEGFGFGINQAHEFFIMQSNENAIEMISFMSNYSVYNRGTSAEDLIIIALNHYGFNQSDFTDVDWDNIVEKANHYAFHTRVLY